MDRHFDLDLHQILIYKNLSLNMPDKENVPKK